MAYPHILISSLSLYLVLFTLFTNPHLTLSTRHSITLNLNRPSITTQPIGDVHDILAQYGLPKGIVPNKVDSYTLSDDGSFEIVLQSSCYVQFELLVYYEKVIKGKMSYGSVSNVNGIQAKKLFFWLPVTGMDTDFESDMIEFHVGALSEKLPAKQFETVPTCKSKACQESNTQSF